MIKTVIKSQSGMVMVFDADGEQVPEYQGRYEDVKTHILRDAPPAVVFAHWFGYADEPVAVARGDW